MEIICVYDVDLSLCDFLGKPDVIFGYSPLISLDMSETIGYAMMSYNRGFPRKMSHNNCVSRS